MAKQKKEIIIANPMYDAVFKHLITSDKETAKYFIGTILGEKIIDINFDIQEYTYKKEVKTPESKSKTIKLIRLDFVATIRTKKGNGKKVLIEIQQTQKPTDFTRFRTYLGKQYMLEDNDDQTDEPLPIIVIYMLGFKMPQIPKIAVKIKRSGNDMLYGGNVKLKDPLIDALTHDAYFIQVSRLQREMYKDWKKCSKLMKMLSLFQQDFFVDEKFLKQYPYPITDKNLKKMITTLEYTAADPKIRRAMEEQHFAELDVILWNKTLDQHVKNLAKHLKTIDQQGKALDQKDKAIDQYVNTIAKQSHELEEYKRRYGNLNNVNGLLN
ncbi:MAG: hypothetical protein FWH18_09720 [Marinilabiliaceae bacterium]|nr:hypothetical protein [Marinilabiliaceae bacterium]